MSTAPSNYTRQANFTSYEQSYPTTPKSGASLDAEFNAVRTVVNAVIARLLEIQRDDGALANGVVTPDSFSAGALLLMGSADWTPRGLWVTTTTYAVNDLVTQSGLSYVCLVEHVSGVFATDLAAAKWQTIAVDQNASNVDYTPNGDVVATNVQDAIDELDADLTAAIGILQPISTKLTNIDALAWLADYLPYFTGASAISKTALTAYARTILAVNSSAGLNTVGVASTGANVFTGTQTVRSTDDGGAEGPTYDLDRNSATPAANDLLSALRFLGRNSAAAATVYAKIAAEIIDVTAASEDGRLRFLTMVAGTVALRFYLGAGLYSLNATGGDKGIDTLNVSQVYTNGVKGAPVDYIEFRDQKAAGTDAGGFTSGSFAARTITTEVSDVGAQASVAANQITLAAGTYECWISAPALAVNSHQARLRNITDGTTELVGSSEYAAAASSQTTRSVIVGRFTIAAAKVFEVQHRCETTKATDGLGNAANFGELEVYTIARFWKVG